MLLPMTFLPILAAAAMSVPNAEADGFAQRMFRAKPDGNVFTDLFLGPDGRVEHCVVIYSEGSRRDGERYCEVALGLMAGEPALGPDGNAAYGMANFDLIVRPEGVPNARVPSRPADIELTVASLPARFGARLRVRVAVFVSDSGVVLECMTEGEGPADYGAAACQQLGQIPRPIMRNTADKAVAYVDGLLVDFVVEPAG